MEYGLEMMNVTVLSSLLLHWCSEKSLDEALDCEVCVFLTLVLFVSW